MKIVFCALLVVLCASPLSGQNKTSAPKSYLAGYTHWKCSEDSPWVTLRYADILTPWGSSFFVHELSHARDASALGCVAYNEKLRSDPKWVVLSEARAFCAQSRELVMSGVFKLLTDAVEVVAGNLLFYSQFSGTRADAVDLVSSFCVK